MVLHLWQAVQITIDLAVSWSVRAGLGAPPTYGEAFRNLVVHGYADLDLRRVHKAARTGPTDLRAFAAHLLQAEGLG